MVCVVADEVIPTQVAIPVYLPIEVDVADGLEGRSKADFNRLCNNLQQLVNSFDTTPLKYEEGVCAPWNKIR